VNKNIRKYKWILQGIAIYEVIGGLIGIGIISQQLVQNVNINILPLIGLPFYLFSCYAGVRLFIKKEFGLYPSQLLQLLQVLAISFGGYTYLFSSGGLIFLGFNGATESFQIQFSIFSSSYYLSFNRLGYPDFFYVNLLPFMILALIEGTKNRIMQLANPG